METEGSQPNDNATPDPVTDLLIGISDGGVIPFILLSGLTGAGMSVHHTVVFTIIAVSVWAIAMAMGRYFVTLSPGQGEGYNSGNTLSSLDFDDDTKAHFEKELHDDKETWKALAGEEEVNESAAARLKSAANVGIAYITGGSIPIIFLKSFHNLQYSFVWCGAATILLLFVLGYYKNKYTGFPAVGGALRLTVLCALGAFAAWLIGSIFVF